MCYDETENLTQKIRKALKKSTSNHEQDVHETPIPTDKQKKDSNAKEPDDDETVKNRDKASSLP